MDPCRPSPVESHCHRRVAVPQGARLLPAQIKIRSGGKAKRFVIQDLPKFRQIGFDTLRRLGYSAIAIRA
jgi:hypothetical protein